MDLRKINDPKKRRKYLEKINKVSLENIGKVVFENNDRIHIENLIGGTTLPLGIAGPLQIKNEKLKVKNYFVPLATTEGALVASVNRGCKAINLSGGATVAVETVGITRGPVYITSGIEEGLRFEKWLDNNLSALNIIAKKTSHHIQLKKIGVRIIGCYVYVRFYFDTGEAMGMNMVTIATDLINKYIEEKTAVKCLSITGNFCVDKKPSWINFISGRGRRVWAETVLKNNAIKTVLKTDPHKLFDIWLAKCMIGSAMSGSLGFNAHYANILAAFFAATGQDLAHVTECSIGITTMKIEKNNDLYVSVYLPDIMLGMVGGGVKLAIKQEALSIVRAKNTNGLAQVLGGAVLAGEISLIASLAEGSLAKAHEKLGR